MAQNLIINLISVVALDKEQALIDSFFKPLSKDIYLISQKSSTTYSIILKNTTKKPDILIIRNDSLFEVTLESTDIGNSDVLSTIFRKILENEKNISFTNKILYCWGHAMGFSLFSKITEYDKFLKALFSASFIENFFSIFNENNFNILKGSISDFNDENPVFDLFMKTVSRNPLITRAEQTALTINELCKSIKANTLTFDLVVFDNCYMQTVDTIYSLAASSISEYIIAPQTSIHWRGYDYTVFDHLDHKINDAFCSSFCKASYDNLVAFSESRHDNNIAEISISCINTKKAKPFFKAANNFIITLYNILEGHNSEVSGSKMASAIDNALKKAKDVTRKPDGHGLGLELFDISILFGFIVEKINNTELNNQFKEFLTHYGKMIITRNASPFFNAHTTGVSICFPKTFNPADPNSYYFYFIMDGAQIKSQFADSNWDDLLASYYEYD